MKQKPPRFPRGGFIGVAEIVDLGPRISDRAPHLFERFYRARGDEQTPGHGLGLSIARELARAHGGDLTLASAQSDWTEFCLRLSASSIHVQTQKPPPATQEWREDGIRRKKEAG